MKKILLASDGIHFSEGAFEFARRMNEIERILVTGLFLPQSLYANLWNYADSMNGPLFIPIADEAEDAMTKKNIELFEQRCRKNGVEYRVRSDFFDLALPELKKETRYADLAIIGSEKFYQNTADGEPNDYLKEALHKAGCAVVVVPEKYVYPGNNILAYDGSDESVYAIKQFTYLFPELAANPTLLVYGNDQADNEIPDEPYIEELAARHFPDLTIHRLDIYSKEYFITWLSEKKSAILVSGAFSRSSFSQLFKKSFVTEVIKDHQLPVFVTHR
jgi:hypothetical protein